MAALSLVHDGFADLATAGLPPEEARAHWEAGVLALAQAAEHLDRLAAERFASRGP